MVPCPLHVPVVGEVYAIFETALIHIERSEAREQNIFERMAILYRGLDRFPGDLRKRVKSLMAQYGTVSDTPDDIAEFLEEFVLAISPNLQGKQPSNPL